MDKIDKMENRTNKKFNHELRKRGMDGTSFDTPSRQLEVTGRERDTVDKELMQS